MNQEAFQKIFSLAYGHIPVQALVTAVEFRIVDNLSSGPKTAKELAKIAKVDADFLGRVLLFLVSLEVFEYEADTGRFSNNEASLFLGEDHPLTLAPTLRMYGAPWAWKAWGTMKDAVKMGKSAFKISHKIPLFNFLQKNKHASAIFDYRMNGRPERRLKPLLENYDFSSFNRVVDVGGGQGGILFGILEKYPHLLGVLFDLKTSIDRASKQAKARGLDKRCEFVSGDFFKKVPSKGDLYILAIVLHDWTASDCVRILKNCRKAMSPNGKIILLERVVSPEKKQPDVRMIDLEMLVMTEGGRERSETEYAKLFALAGFSLERVVTAQPMNIVEGRPR
jgi:SAM-dependent methyltransferase